MLIFSKPVEIESVEKNSRFIAVGLPCQSIDEFKQYLRQLQQRFADATHITYAYKMYDNGTLRIKLSDDGEPSGTAGKPILNHMEGVDLINGVIFVVRYFGGTKLGAGGLVRAYGNAAKECLAQGKLENYIEYTHLQFFLAYSQKKQLDYSIKLCAGHVKDIDYGEKLNCYICIPKQNLLKFWELLPDAKTTS